MFHEVMSHGNARLVLETGRAFFFFNFGAMEQRHLVLPNYSYADYCQWEGRWELIEGIPHAMSPLPIPKHQRIAGDIHALFWNALRKKRCKKCRAYQPLDYKLSEKTILQPDMLVVCGEIRKAFLDFPPALVVEVLSPSTASKDRLYKFNTYQQQGIRYYLIVDVKEETIEVYELENGSYVLRAKDHDFTFSFSFPEGCEAAIDFGEVWR